MRLKRVIALGSICMLGLTSTVNVKAMEVDEISNKDYYDYISEETGVEVEQLRYEEKENGSLEDLYNIFVPEELKEEVQELTIESNVKKDDNYYEYLSAYTDKSVKNLKKIERQNGDLLDYYGLNLQVDVISAKLVEEVRNTEVINSGSSSDSSSSKKMSDDQWSYMKGKADKGDILVSKDQSTLGVNHGHAAIVYSDSSLTVEHTGEGKSACYGISRWSNRYTMRDYYPSGTTGDTRRSAANYAYNNLRGWDYFALPLCTNTKEVNCATLVWKAFNSQSVVLQKTGVGGCTPICFVEGNAKTNLWAGVNWSGGDHTW